MKIIKASIILISLSNFAYAQTTITGSGTANNIPKFTAASTIGNSQITDNGTTVSLGTASVAIGAAAVTSGDFLTVTKNYNGLTRMRLNNTSTGTAASTSFNIISLGASLNLASYGLQYSPLGIAQPTTNVVSAFGNGGLNIVTTSAASTANLTFGTNSITRMTITNTGSVGIGTTTPDKLFTVSSTGGNAQVAKFADNARYIGLGRDEVAAFDLAGNPANLYIGGQKLNILTTGEVGIGTTTPYKKLSVNGDVSFLNINGNSAFEIVGNGAIPSRRGISLDNDPSGKFNFYVHGWQTNAGFNFKNSLDNSTLVSINVGGRTDINTTVKTDKYFVINDLSVPASPVETFAINGNGYTKINVVNPTAMVNVFDVYDATNSLNLFRINTLGHVYAREVEILPINTSFPDYVFEKDYKLLSLNEVENYINTNKHLPGFEKGEVYDQNGIKTSELIYKQQEKIEELTLYIIELEKRLGAIEKKIKN